MYLNKLATLLAVGAFAVLAPACAIESAAGDDPDAEQSAATQDELSSNANKLVGSYQGSGGSVRPPTFLSLDLRKDGTFKLDVDTGIRCITTPCPSGETVTGRFTATRSYLRLRPMTPTAPQSHYHGSYRYTLVGDALSLSRADWNGWTSSMERANDVWPEDATRLVADSPGGGFVAPSPPGSTCGIGKQKYTFDVPKRQLSWEVCDSNTNGKPFHLVIGSRVLSQAEAAQVDAAANAVKISTRDMCGADKPMLKLLVTTPAGTKTYTDSFYSCMGQGPFVDGIDEVFATLRGLAK
jgi:hypothetical protein